MLNNVLIVLELYPHRCLQIISLDEGLMDDPMKSEWDYKHNVMQDIRLGSDIWD